MKFERVRPGKYRARLQDSTFVWVVREWSHRWWWFIGDEKGIQEIWADGDGPFNSHRNAMADAIANYGWAMTNKIAWWVHRPTYTGGRVKPPALWRLKPVIAGSELDNMLAAGELHELPGEWHRFTSRAEAEAWLSAEFDRYRR